MKRFLTFSILMLFFWGTLNAQTQTADSELFSLEDIEFWTGSGYKRAAMVIQWQTSTGTHCYVWGYKFDGTVNFMDMMTEIIENDLNLGTVKMPVFTNAIGVGGIGYNPYNDGKPFALKFAEETLPLYKGVYWSSTAMQMERFQAVNPSHFWDGGWYEERYTSYYFGESIDDLSYSNSMPEITDVADGSWHAWTFSELQSAPDPETGDYINTEVNPKAAKAAPTPIKQRDNSIAQPTASLSIEKKEYTIQINEKIKVALTVKPTDATFKSAKWESSDNHVAYVINGNIYGVSNGEVTITASAIDQPSVKTKCKLIVTSVPVEKITLNTHSHRMKASDRLQLTAMIEPAAATVKEIKWTSSDLKVASVIDGLVLPKDEGVVTITATTVSNPNIKDQCVVTITKTAVEAVELIQKTLELVVGESKKLAVIITPEKASNKDLSWAASTDGGKNIMTVSREGVVTAILKGKARVRVSSVDNPEAYDECIVTVTDPIISVSGVSLNEVTKELEVSETFQLIATVKPSNADNAAISWSSSDKTVATVDAVGIIKAVAVGVATITVTTEDGGYTATCEVTVKEDSSVAIDMIDGANILVYPTITIGTIYITQLQSEETVQIFDFSGRLVLSEKLQAGDNTIHIHSFNRGIYFVKVGDKVVKVVKQ